MIAANKNPLRLDESASDKHPHHQTKNGRSKTCKKCCNESLRKPENVLACPNCGLCSLHIRETHPELNMDDEAEIYCSACGLHWGRTNNW